MPEFLTSRLARAGGFAFLVAGVGYAGLMAVLFSTGGEPSNLIELIDKLAEHASAIRIVGLSFLVVELSMLVGFVSLMSILMPVNRTWSIIGGILALIGLAFDLPSSFIVFDLPNLAVSYSFTTGDTRSADRALIEFFYQYVWMIETPAHVAVVSLAILILSLVVLRSPSRHIIGYIGLVIGATGLIGGALGFIPAAMTWIIWFFPTGASLVRFDPSELMS
jgi:hypothetical protein